MTILSIVQNIGPELGVGKPSSVISSNDTTVAQMLALANRSGKNHAKNAVFEALTKEGHFATVAVEDQGAVLTIAPDFDRMLPETMFDRTQHWRVNGPLTPSQWQQRLSVPIVSAILRAFCIRGGHILFNPVPVAGSLIYFSYMSKFWAAKADGTPQTSFLNDADTAVIDENLIELDVKWRFLKAKGMDYSEEFRDYQVYLVQTLGSDGANKVLHADDEGPGLPLTANVSDGSWPLS